MIRIHPPVAEHVVHIVHFHIIINMTIGAVGFGKFGKMFYIFS